MTEAVTVTTLMPFSTVLEEDIAQTTNRQASDPTAVPWVLLPMKWSWWVIVQLFSAILGICGNLLVMLVMFNKRRARRSTDTLIGALALADFLTSVFLIPHPQIATLPSDTWLAQVYCRIIHTSLIMWVAVKAGFRFYIDCHLSGTLLRHRTSFLLLKKCQPCSHLHVHLHYMGRCNCNE